MAHLLHPISAHNRLTVASVPKDIELHAPHRSTSKSMLAGASLHIAIAGVLLALTVMLIVSGLVPAIFVALVFLLPAVAPVILLGLGILATAELKVPDDRLCDPNQPCCCGRH